MPNFFDDSSYANADRGKFIAQIWTKNIRSNVDIFGLGMAFSVQPNDVFHTPAGFIVAELVPAERLIRKQQRDQ